MSGKNALFLDIDGCLISSDGNVCLESYQANSRIAELIRKGNVGEAPSVRLCSSRDRNSVEVMAMFFGIVNSWMIVESGAALYNPTTHEYKLNPAITLAVRKLFRWLKTVKVPAILKRYSCLQEYLGYMVCCGLERKKESFSDAETILQELKQRGGKLHKLIKARKIRVKRFGDFIDILPPSVSKGSGARFLAKLEGIDLARSVVIGDSEADFSLFRQVGMIGCPSNATPKCQEYVKGRHGKVSIHPYSKGVLDIIDWYLGGIEE